MVRYKGREAELVLGAVGRVNFMTECLWANIQLQQLCAITNFLQASERDSSGALEQVQGHTGVFPPSNCTALPPWAHCCKSRMT